MTIRRQPRKEIDVRRHGWLPGSSFLKFLVVSESDLIWFESDARSTGEGERDVPWYMRLRRAGRKRRSGNCVWIMLDHFWRSCVSFCRV